MFKVSSVLTGWLLCHDTLVKVVPFIEQPFFQISIVTEPAAVYARSCEMPLVAAGDKQKQSTSFS